MLLLNFLHLQSNVKVKKSEVTDLPTAHTWPFWVRWDSWWGTGATWHCSFASSPKSGAELLVVETSLPKCRQRQHKDLTGKREKGLSAAAAVEGGGSCLSEETTPGMVFPLSHSISYPTDWEWVSNGEIPSPSWESPISITRQPRYYPWLPVYVLDVFHVFVRLRSRQFSYVSPRVEQFHS